MKKLLVFLLVSVVLWSCATIPDGLQVVQPFNQEKYLGKWYEIARSDNRFEKNLQQVTAEYSRRDDGKIKVINSGFNTEKNKRSSVEGKAKFRGADTAGALKVSFFGPFYAAYNVIAVDDNYQYALVAGKNLKYLWLLSRTTTIPDTVRDTYLLKASSAGYDTSALVWVNQPR